MGRGPEDLAGGRDPTDRGLLDLIDRLPVVRLNTRAGNGDTRRSRMIADRTRFLDPALVALVEDAILGRLATLTARQLDRVIDQIIGTHDPASARAKAEQAARGRQVHIGPTGDDHADINGTLDAIGATVLDRRLDELAKLLGQVTRTLGDTARFGTAGETLDQRRARALVLLATPTEVATLIHLAREGRAHQTRPATGLIAPVTLYVHLRADHTLDLEGLGILSVPTVADLLGSGATTVRVQPVIDLNTTYTTNGYQPSTTNASLAWPRGPTATTNAGVACRGHHNVKTHGDWQVHQPTTSVYVWQAPTGHVYIVTPHGTHPMN